MSQSEYERVDHPLTAFDMRNLPDGIYVENCTFEQWLKSTEEEYMAVMYGILLHRAQENLRCSKIF